MQKRSNAIIERTGSRNEEIDEAFEETYERIVMTCYRYLDFKSLEQVDNITPFEYRILMKSKELQIVDKHYEIHLQAYLNMTAQARRPVGKKLKPVYTKFDKFFDYQKQLDRVMGIKKKSKFDGLAQFIKEQKKEG